MSNKNTIPKERAYNPKYTPPPLQVAFTIDDEIISPTGGITIFSGLPKNGKTFFLTATIASYFLNDELFKLRLKLPANKPLISYMDTETPEHSFYKNIDLIKKFANGKFNENNFEAYRLRGLDSNEMINLIENYVINTPLCGCIVIDGLLELVIDENSPNEAKRIDTMLKNIGNNYNVTILAVLHTNRGGNDTNGKLGSRMDKTADSVLLIKKNKEQKNVYDLTGTLLRYAKKELETISIRREDNSVEYVETEKPFKQRTYKDWTMQEHKHLASTTIPTRGYTYKEMLDDIQASQAIGVSYSKQIVKVWIAEKIISQKQDKLYYFNP
jgi:hypothetical protein